MKPDKEAPEFGHSNLTFEELESQVQELAKGSPKIEPKPLSSFTDEELKLAIMMTGRAASQVTKHNKLMDEFMRRNQANETPEEKEARLEYLRNRKATEAIVASKRGPRFTPSQKSKRKKR